MKYEYLIVKINREGCIYDTQVKYYAKEAHHCAKANDIVMVCEAGSCYYVGFRWTSDKVIKSYLKGKNNSRIWLYAEPKEDLPDWWERDIEAEKKHEYTIEKIFDNTIRKVSKY